jgi:endonuclease YncB( thermonuclease family)
MALPRSVKSHFAAAAAGAALGGLLAWHFSGAPAGDCPVPAKEAAIGDVLRGPVPAAKIHDADTIHIAKDGKDYSIRIYGIDAPELRQVCIDADNEQTACGRLASAEMLKIIGSGEVSCEIKSLDRLYNRVVGQCRNDKGTDIGRELVKRGYAYNESHTPEIYRAEREAAEMGKKGLWAGRAFMDPKEWRDLCTSRGHKGDRPEFCSVLNKTRRRQP